MEGRVSRSGESMNILPSRGQWEPGAEDGRRERELRCYITHTQTDGHTQHKAQELKPRTHTHTLRWTHKHKAAQMNRDDRKKMNGLARIFTHSPGAAVHPPPYSSILFSSHTRCQPVWDNNRLNAHTNAQHQDDVGGDAEHRELHRRRIERTRLVWFCVFSTTSARVAETSSPRSLKSN